VLESKFIKEKELMIIMKYNDDLLTEKMIEKVMPEYQEKMREIGVQRAREISGIGESPETIAERIKNKISMTDQNTERINLFEIFMEAKNNWLMQKRYETGSHSK